MNVVNFRDIILGDKIGRGASGEVRKCTFDGNQYCIKIKIGAAIYLQHAANKQSIFNIEKKKKNAVASVFFLSWIGYTSGMRKCLKRLVNRIV